ncbi:MAG: GSCFA domain-containing protein [Rhodospirillaceae bacterium]
MASNPKSNDDGPLLLDSSGGLSTDESVSREMLIDLIFDDPSVKAHLRDAAKKQASSLVDQAHFLTFCKSEIERRISTPALAPAGQAQLARLYGYIENTNQVLNRFNKATKPNPDAMFWPDPTRGGPVLGDVLPIAREQPFIERSTKIGSAGSCFAVEIARFLMGHGFNYLAPETSFDPETGVIMMGTSRINPEIQFSCRWGILFNTPSFTQIVENAFGVHALPEILIAHTEGEEQFYIDPYREGIAFPSPAAYRAERDRHLANTRDVFTQADVFVITLGLNEAWRFIPDGTYISRNPRNPALTGFLDHRTLTVQENVDYLQRFIDVVRAHNPGLKLIVTVSPVPFMATGRADEYHVVTANTHSKAVLRVAAQEIVERNRDVYYFPSYEVVTVCSPDIWTEDQRHIHGDAVARVMKTFAEMFMTRGAKKLMKLAAR